MIRELFEHVSGRKNKIDNRTVFFKAIESIFPNIVRKVGQKSVEILFASRSSPGIANGHEPIANGTLSNPVFGSVPSSFNHVHK